ncbi:hypothetical protein Ancab_029119 [Ancistrocladus abbreviatus]
MENPMVEESLPPGFRFHPTDEELITYYLTRKVSDFTFTSKAIAEVDLNKCEPWDLPSRASMGEKEWYFFSLRDRKYPTGLRTNRATEAGYWKTTGKDKEIFRGGMVVGMKKTLVFYRGRAPKGEKTNWVMHEYRLEAKVSFKTSKEEWVVCRVFQKSTTIKKPQQTSSLQPSLDSPGDANMNANEFRDVEPMNLNSISGSTVFNNPSLQNYSNNANMNTNVNWASLPSLTWPTNLLNPTFNTVNSLLVKALQFRAYHQREAGSSSNHTFTMQGMSHMGSNFSPHYSSPSTKGLESVPLPQQQQLILEEEQPLNLDSIW